MNSKSGFVAGKQQTFESTSKKGKLYRVCLEHKSTLQNFSQQESTDLSSLLEFFIFQRVTMTDSIFAQNSL